MDITKLPPARTLGSLLVEETRRLQTRNIPKPPWLAPFTLVRQHISALPLASVSRFQRRDAKISSLFAPAPGSFLEHLASVSGAGAVLQGTARTRLTTQDESLDAARLSAVYARHREASPAGQPLSTEVRAGLRAASGETAIGVDAWVHDDETSDALARRERAAAVTIGRHIYFRQGQFRPRDRGGQALLAHEMVHVRAAMQPNSAWRRATTGGVQEEEQVALAREQQVLLTGLGAKNPANWSGSAERLPRTADSPFPPAMQPSAGTQPAHPPLPGSPSSPAFRPLAAASDRNITSPIAGSRVQPATSEGPRASYQDLLRQIRIDFERGG